MARSFLAGEPEASTAEPLAAADAGLPASEAVASAAERPPDSAEAAGAAADPQPEPADAQEPSVAPIAPSQPEPDVPETAAAPPPGPGAGTMWVQVKRIQPDQLEDGTIRRIEVFGNRMALARVEGEFFVLEGRTPGGPGQLGDGAMEGHVVVCNVTGLGFDVRDGVCVSNSELVAKTFASRIKKDRFFVQVDE
ncbi:MAG: hypothetical protein CMP23_16050 [Rickettsiales bacterium]|nr:hypothetical protein [Rickettsiales bacterium]